MLAIAFLLIGLAFAGPDRARAMETFVITGVGVDETAATAQAARDIALRNGQRVAFERLLRRLTLRGGRAKLPVFSDREITALIGGFSVESEKNSATRYIASLTYHFKEDEIRALLRLNDVAFTASPAKPILVLPVYQSTTGPVLWDDPNPWRDAWAQREANDSLMQIVVPFGDLEDLAAIDATGAVAGNEEGLTTIARRYRVQETLVVHARTGYDLVTGQQVLHATLRRVGPFGTRVIIEEFAAFAGEGLDALMVRVAAEIARRLEEEWKAMTLLDFSTGARISAQVPLKGLAGWLEVRKRLADNARVRSVEIQSLSVNDAQVIVSFIGDPQQLAVALAQSDLDLSFQGGFWSLELRQMILPGEKNEPVPIDAVLEEKREESAERKGTQALPVQRVKE